MTVLLALLLVASPDHRLLPGADGRLCLGCHDEFQATLKKPFVHTPVKSQQCTGCHNPHASRHGKLLSADPNKVCATCHGSVVPEKAKSVHKPVADGNCVGCHDPHGSDAKFELVAKGNELCGTCHKALTEAATRARVPHAPLQKGGCVACHEPHGSTKGDQLLKANDARSLCTSCHSPSKAGFAKAHQNYPVAQARCTGCHDPHGSDRKGMLYDTVHRPMANRACADCHTPPVQGKPPGLKVAGAALCKDCHAAQVAKMFEKTRVHAAVVDPEACLNCHTPHASRARGLVKDRLTVVCSACHQDTIDRQSRSPTPHPPVRDGACATCHDVHSSDAPLMVKKDVMLLCGSCHDYERHSTHPIGPKVKDPRNKNLTLDCLSCHRAHGTDYKHMIAYPTTTELCVKCHQQYRR